MCRCYCSGDGKKKPPYLAAGGFCCGALSKGQARGDQGPPTMSAAATPVTPTSTTTSSATPSLLRSMNR